MADRIGIIAGNGIYPETFISAARKAGVKHLAVAAFEGETKKEVADLVDAIKWLRVGQLTKLIQFFKSENITECVMVGQIAPRNLFDLRPDLRVLKMLGRIKERNAESLFGGIADELKSEGITLLPATTYLDEFLPAPGLVAGPAPKDRKIEEAAFGFRIAKESSRLDIGQTVVVKKGTVLAVEAFEGTNAAIQRGGELGKGNATMAKVSKPNQDFRFDVPVVGPATIQTAAEAGIDQIVVEAYSTLLLGSEDIATLCHDHKITLYAMASAESN